MRFLRSSFAVGLVLALLSSVQAIASPAREADSKPVRIGLMADFTGLPFLVAEREGLFAKEGISVAFSIFRSATERDAALQSGALDGCNADVISVLSNRRAGFDVQIVASALNRFSLLLGPKAAAAVRGSGREPALSDLVDAGIGLSRNTVIEYVVDSLMDGVGAYKKVDIPRIPVRLELFLQGELEGASLPLPFDELAVSGGAAIVADSVSAGLDPDLFMFYRAELEGRPETYRALWRAIDAARLLIEADGSKYRDLLSSRLGFSTEQAASVAFPAFPVYAPTSMAELDRAATWMLGRGLLETKGDLQAAIAQGILP